MITSSPGRQFTGVATVCRAVSCTESRARNTSLKSRPVLIGYRIENFSFLSGPMTKTARIVALSAAVRVAALPLAFGWIMSYSLETFRSVSPISG
jgi:hypothetical protein